MPEQFLHGADVVAVFEEMGRKRMEHTVPAECLRMPAARAASATAFCTTDSCRWSRDGGPNCGSRQIRAAGNTNCHFHSVDAVIVQRFFELVLRVDRVERRDDRAELPRAEFRDEELGAVRQEQADAVAAPDAERRE